MPEVVRMTVNDTEIKLGLQQFAKRMAARPMLIIIGETERGSVMKTFEEEGSPAHSWAPLAPSTLKRLKGKASGKKILFDKGRLKNSVISQASANSVEIGTNLVYAAVHQYGSRGGVQRVPLFTRRQKSRDVKEGRGKGRRLIAKGIASVRAHSRRMNIPARPFIVFRPEDPERLEAALNRFIEQQAQASGFPTK